MIIELVAVVIIALVLYINEFFHSWRESVKNEESLEREKLALQYEALKNQVNPHFLFNSLNTLSGLIGKDADRAQLFVKQLSDIYRYILEQKDRELVPLETEIKFVDNYISLMKIRFGENLKITKNIPSKKPYRIIPLSVQMLVENAIKHNIISKDMPLSISIEVRDDQLEVKNNFQRKSSIMHEEVGEWEKHGLANLKSRYAYLSEGQFLVNGSFVEPFPDELEGHFVVHVPLIGTKDEGTDH
jgi:LytS/YehU family sensor histidine kinase